ncbi:inactive polypeptide N-acetylgalactosaminyltransferase-like protein 5, partial [Carlito syrichta]|uniref:Inactive polypeptide N-acetylgalactosaminyltransferase-like protein 5 n=1 Tax=Carlito syrichta TaxID=1868482 RepID=A0A1U7UYA9_CARSF
MRNATIQCFFYGFMIFGFCTASLYVYLYYSHENSQEKKSHEPTSVRSPEKNVHQQSIHDSEQMPTPHAVVEGLDEDENEPKRLQQFINRYKNVNHSDPEFLSGFSKYGFNIIVSRHLDNQREVPDTRNKMCLGNYYSKRLPTASVIICFHNEEFHALFRTVSSVMSRTPDHFLEEIVLVDDMSEFDDLKEKLDHHLEVFRGKIKLIRTTKREGLIRARLIGASRASGDVLVFLDSHCEVNTVWLEPLLKAIAKDPKMVVCPLIDVIDHITLEYKPFPLVRGIFDWKLQFKWDRIFSYEMDGSEGPSKPIR